MSNISGLTDGLGKTMGKVVNDMHIKKADSGGYVVQHNGETHAVPDMKSLHKHMDKNLGPQNKSHIDIEPAPEPKPEPKPAPKGPSFDPSKPPSALPYTLPLDRPPLEHPTSKA